VIDGGVVVGVDVGVDVVGVVDVAPLEGTPLPLVAELVAEADGVVEVVLAAGALRCVNGSRPRPVRCEFAGALSTVIGSGGALDTGKPSVATCATGAGACFFESAMGTAISAAIRIRGTGQSRRSRNSVHMLVRKLI
jgi:hypothetical protein